MAAQEATFRAYSQQDGTTYAAGRPGYSPELFKIIIDHHKSTGGKLDTVIDVGCGPGLATRDLARYFANTIGLDPSQGMIDAAHASTASSSSPMRFEVSAAESLGLDLDPAIQENSVDMITAATAAHWFDMNRFWQSAARVLKPGGTVAIWTRTGVAIDPARTANGAAVKAAVEQGYRMEVQSFTTAGNKMTQDLYVDLPLPWTIEEPLNDFDKDSFFRKEWNRGKEGIDVDGLATGGMITPEILERVVSTGSPVTRWREAHPDKAGTEEDVIGR